MNYEGLIKRDASGLTAHALRRASTARGSEADREAGPDSVVRGRLKRGRVHQHR